MLVSVFSDASMCSQTGACGWGGWAKSQRNTTRCGGPMRARIWDINIAESMAVVNTVATALKQGTILRGDDILIQTDNTAVESILRGRSSMTSANSHRKSKKHRESRQKQRNAVHAAWCKLMQDYNLTFRWRHIKGHTQDKAPRSAVNRMCDEAAGFHMRTLRKELRRTESAEVDSKAEPC